MHTYIYTHVHAYIYIQTYTQAYMSACLSGMYVCMTVCIHICYARRQTAKHVELHFRRASRNRMYKALACLLRSSGVSGCHVWGLGFTYRLRDYSKPLWHRTLGPMFRVQGLRFWCYITLEFSSWSRFRFRDSGSLPHI